MEICSYSTIRLLGAARISCLFFIITFSSSCNDVLDVYSPQEWRKLFADSGGWTPLPIPDSKYRPGSIIQVNKEGIRWIDHLQSCNYPDQFVEHGVIPQINFAKSKSFGADVLLNYHGIEAGPEYNQVKRVTLKVSEHSADALKLLSLKIWQEDPDNRAKISPVCMVELDKPSVYLITESFTVSKGTYSLYGDTGSRLKLASPMIDSLLDLESNVNYNVTAEGDLEINEPAVFGIRKAVRMAGDFTVLGDKQHEPVAADSEIEALYFQVHSD